MSTRAWLRSWSLQNQDDFFLKGCKEILKKKNEMEECGGQKDG